MTRRGFIPYGPSGAAVEALARVMAADLAGTPVTANILLPGGATATGMIPDEMRDELRANLLDPAIMGPPIVWLASPDAAGVHDERIVARDFDEWLEARERPEAARVRISASSPGRCRAHSSGSPACSISYTSAGTRCSNSQSSKAPGHGLSRSRWIDSPAALASRSADLARGLAAHEDQLERAVQVDDEPRAQALDQCHLRLRLRLGACVRAGGRVVRAVRRHPELARDPRWIRARSLGQPGRCREVAVQIDAGGVLPRAVQQAVRVQHGHDSPARLVRRHALEQPAREQRRVALLAVLCRREQAGDRTVAFRHEHAHRHAVARAAELLGPPAAQLVARHPVSGH